MDWKSFHFFNQLLVGHGRIAEELSDFMALSVPVFALGVLSLWLFARPGSPSRWKTAAVSGLGSAALALLINQVISSVWVRDRPITAHPLDAHLFFVPASGDPSFPSDHAAAAFAIAFAVLFLVPRVGYGFLAAAAAIAFDRVLLGLHYPGDIVAGMLVGLVSAGAIHLWCQQPVGLIVTSISRLTDPVSKPLWNRLRPEQP